MRQPLSPAGVSGAAKETLATTRRRHSPAAPRGEGWPWLNEHFRGRRHPSRALWRWEHGVMGLEDADDRLRSGREALAAADWERARSFFERAREYEETPEVLDGLSEVAHFHRQYERASELKERAFAAYRRAGRGQRRPTSPAGLPSSMPRATETSWSRAAGWVGPRASWKESRSAL